MLRSSFLLIALLLSGCGRSAPLALRNVVQKSTPLGNSTVPVITPTPSPSASPTPPGIYDGIPESTPVVSNPVVTPTPNPPNPPPASAPISLQAISGTLGAPLGLDVRCVDERSPAWTDLPTENWHPLSQEFGGAEMRWQAKSSAVDLSLNGVMTVGSRTGLTVMMEIVNVVTGSAHREVVGYLGTTGHTNLAVPIQYRRIFQLTAGQPYSLRIALYTQTPDDGSCTPEVPQEGFVQVTGISATIVELP